MADPDSTAPGDQPGANLPTPAADTLNGGGAVVVADRAMSFGVDWRAGWICLLLFVLVLWTYAPAIHNQFVGLDDPDYVTANVTVQRGLTWDNLLWALRSTAVYNWHPVTWVSHLLDCQWFGLQPWGHHLTSVLIHALNTVLVFLLFQRMTAATWRSGLVAALFGLHPLHVESVAWVSERKDVLSALFGLLTLLLYARYAQNVCKVGTSCVSSEPIENHGRHAGRPYQKPNQVGTSCVSSGGAAAQPYQGMAPTRRSALPGWPRRSAALPDYCSAALPDRHGPTLDYLLALLFFALGLMSKPMLVTLPFVLLLLDYWPLGRFSAGTGSADALAELPTVHDPGGAGLAGPDATQRVPTTTTDATPVLRSSTAEGGQRGPTEIEHPVCRLFLEKVPFLILAAAACVITFAVQKQAGGVTGEFPFPARLGNAVVSYGRYLGKLCWPTGLAAFYPHPGRWPAAIVGLAGAVLAVIFLVSFALRRRHRYLPTGWLWFLGMLVPVIGFVQVGVQAMADRYSYLPAIGIFIMVIWGLADLTGRWRGRGVILAAAAAVALICCGVLSRKQIGYWRDSETLFRRALAVTRNNYLAHDNLGTALSREGKLAEAIVQYEEALRIKPDFAEAHNNLGVCLQKQNQPAAAVDQFIEAIRLKPELAEAHFNLGCALGDAGRADAAITQYEAALRLKPDYADARFNLGNTLNAVGRTDEAISQLQIYLKSNPNIFEARYLLGVLFTRKGDWAAAKAQLAAALKQQPDFTEARDALGAVLEAEGRLDEAIQQYREGLRLASDSPQTHLKLGQVLCRKGLFDAGIAEFEQALRLKPDYPEAQQGLEHALRARAASAKP